MKMYMMIFTLMATIIAEGQVSITITNPNSPYSTNEETVFVTGTFAYQDSLTAIEYRFDATGNWLPVDSVNIAGQQFFHTLTNLPEGHLFYYFRIRSGTNTASDTLEIISDRTPPTVINTNPSRAYLSKDFGVTLEIEFSEPVNPNGTVRLIAPFNPQDTTDALNYTNVSPNKISLNISENNLPPGTLQDWQNGEPEVYISGFTDKTVGNLMNAVQMPAGFQIDLIRPSIQNVSVSSGILNTINSTTLTVTFDEAMSTNQGVVILQDQDNTQLTLQPDGQRQLNLLLNISNFNNPPDWNGWVDVTIKNFRDVAGNRIIQSTHQNLFQIDLVAPQITNAHFSDTLLNLASVSQPITLSLTFSERVKNVSASLVNEKHSTEASLNALLTTNDSLTYSATFDSSFFNNNGGLSNWQDTVALNIISATDRLNNPLPDTNSYYIYVYVDTYPPSPPTIIGGNIILTREKELLIEGVKEDKAQLFFQDSLVESFTDTTYFQIPLSINEPESHFSLYQKDLAQNQSTIDTLLVVADSTEPLIQEAYLEYHLLPDTLSLLNPYYELTIKFDKIVIIDDLSLFTLIDSTVNEMVDLSKYGANITNQGAIQRIRVDQDSDISRLSQWLSSFTDHIFLQIEPGGVRDVFGNFNTETLSTQVFYQFESFINTLSPKVQFLNPDIPTGEEQFFSVDITLNPKWFTPQFSQTKVIFTAEVVNSAGEKVCEFLKPFKLADGFQDSVNFNIGEGKVVKASNDSIIHWMWNPITQPEGKYLSSFAIQPFNGGSANTSHDVELFLDKSPPRIRSFSPLTGEEVHMIDQTNPFYIEFEVEPEGSPIGGVELKIPDTTLSLPRLSDSTLVYGVDEITLPQGKQTVSFHFWDLAGNIDSLNLTYKVTVGHVSKIIDLYNFPNPFNPQRGEITHISFAYSGESDVLIYIYDISGRIIHHAKLQPEFVGGSGFRRHYNWDGRDLQNNIVANGTYFCRIKAGNQISQILKIAVLNR